MSRDSLESFFQIFDTTDDQGWCDIGYETCDRIVKSYCDDDWNDFVGSIKRLKSEVHLGVIEILPLAPNRFHARLLEALLLHARGEAWLEAFTELSKLSETQPQLVRDILSKTRSRERFEREFAAWVNFPTNISEDFATYYHRYRHLIRSETQQFYESLKEIT